MLLRVDHAAGTPLYEQLAQAVRTALATGDIVDGERLPAARDLADQLDMNMHTVLRAYAVLSDEGLLKVRRGRGAVVVAPRPELPTPVSQALARLIALADRYDVGREQLLSSVRMAP